MPSFQGREEAAIAIQRQWKQHKRARVGKYKALAEAVQALLSDHIIEAIAANVEPVIKAVYLERLLNTPSNTEDFSRFLTTVNSDHTEQWLFLAYNLLHSKQLLPTLQVMRDSLCGKNNVSDAELAQYLSYALHSLIQKELALWDNHNAFQNALKDFCLKEQMVGSTEIAVRYEKYFLLQHTHEHKTFQPIGKIIRAITRQVKSLQLLIDTQANKEEVSKAIIQAEQAQATMQAEQALLDFEELYANQFHPGVARYLREFGEKLQTNEMVSEAIEYSKKLLQMLTRQDKAALLSEQAQIMHSIGKMYHTLGRGNAALEYLLSSCNLYLSIYQETQTLQLASIYESLGLVYYNQFRLSEGMEYFKKALAIYEKISPLNESLVGACYCKIGVGYQDLKQYKQAIHAYEQAMKLYNHNSSQHAQPMAECYMWMALTYGAIGRYEEALFHAEAGMRLQPTENNMRIQAHIHAMKATLALSPLEELQAAERCFKNALTLLPSAHLKACYAGFLLNQKRYEEAIALLQEAFEAKYHNVTVFLGFLTCGSLPDCIQNEISHLSVFRTTPTLFAHFLLILAYLEIEEMGMAHDHLNALDVEVHKLEPFHTHFSLLGYACQSLEEWERAADAFKSAVENFPISAEYPSYIVALKNIADCSRMLQTPDALFLQGEEEAFVLTPDSNPKEAGFALAYIQKLFALQSQMNHILSVVQKIQEVFPNAAGIIGDVQHKCSQIKRVEIKERVKEMPQHDYLAIEKNRILFGTITPSLIPYFQAVTQKMQVHLTINKQRYEAIIRHPALPPEDKAANLKALDTQLTILVALRDDIVNTTKVLEEPSNGRSQY